MGSGHIDSTQEPSADEILQQAQERINARQKNNLTPRKRKTVVDANRAVYWLTKHWLALFNLGVGVYVAGALLAPVLIHFGFSRLADILYAIYGPFCHQYTFRSFFLFGEAFTYPLTGPISVAEMAEQTHIIGDIQLGYKMALCQRDMAIYGMMLVSGVLFGLIRRKTKINPLPFWLYFIFGIMPMMLDGGIQWLSYFIWTIFPAYLAQPFETIPLMRVLTGSLFGLGVIAVTYPIIDEYFQEIHHNLREKFEW